MTSLLLSTCVFQTCRTLLFRISRHWASPVAQQLKNLPAMQEMQQKAQIRSSGQEDPLGKKMATHSSILAWESPWAEEPGNLQSMGSQRVRHDLATKPISMHIVSLNSLPLNTIRSMLSQGFFCSSSGPSISLAFERPSFGILSRVFLQNLLNTSIIMLLRNYFLIYNISSRQ